jgi:hypothetical protein
VLADHFPEIGMEESISPLESLLVTLDKGSQMIFGAAMIAT